MFGYSNEPKQTERGDPEHAEKSGAWENTHYKSSLDNTLNNHSQLSQNKIFTGKGFLWNSEDRTKQMYTENCSTSAEKETLTT